MTEDELTLSVRMNHTPYKRKEFAFPLDKLKRFLNRSTPNERAMPRDSEVSITSSSYITLATKEKLDDELTYILKKYL